MICPICVTKARKATLSKAHREILPSTPNQNLISKNSAHYSLLQHRWTTIDKVRHRLEKATQFEWILLIKTPDHTDPRAWSFTKHPGLYKDAEARHMGKLPRRYMTYTGIVKPSEAPNPNKALRSHIEVHAAGTADLEVSMVDRVEVLLLSPLRGSLRQPLQITQKNVMSNHYTLEHRAHESFTAAFSLHEHEWDNKLHYDMRFAAADETEEWAIAEDPRTLTDSIGIKKTCTNPDLMTYSGDYDVNGVATTSLMLTEGIATVMNISDTERYMIFKSDSMNTALHMTTDGLNWKILKVNKDE